MPDLANKLLNRLGVADAMAHRAKRTAKKLNQAAGKHHDAANAEVEDLAKQIEKAGVGAQPDLEERYCQALVTRGHMAQAHTLAEQDAARMPEVGENLEKGRVNRAKAEAAGQQVMGFDEEEHPREAKGGHMEGYKPGEFVPKNTTEEINGDPPQKEPWQITKQEFESGEGVVYHGGADQYRIRTDRKGSATDNPTSDFGAFFTPQRHEAERYVRDFHGGEGQVMAARLNLKNPYLMSFGEFDRIVEKNWQKMTTPEGMQELRDLVAEIKNELITEGHDGIVVGVPGKQRAQEIVAFDQDAVVQHRYAVEEALKAGKKVSPEVLADYPDLKKALSSPFVPPDVPQWRSKPPEGERFLPLNGVEDREKVRAMVAQMQGGGWKWTKPLIRCGDQLLTGSHRYAAAREAGVPLQTKHIDEVFREAGLDFKQTWEANALPFVSWLSNLDAAVQELPEELRQKYGIDLG